ncbi:hypothetical protein [Cesiribacter sp. SM1]|uniref:hypothetical protein n=1 Tax=Cesiribacter sp. SM1 TaxID=2861196 RepID=UPI001CD1A2B6|nr:hypothetical protein [Cesiribacter sp. SM1]
MIEEVVKDINLATQLALPELKSAIIIFFQAMGFRQIEERNDALHIKRGSEFRNGYTYNPLKWKSDIYIDFRQEGSTTYVKTKFIINTKHQWVTKKEALVWERVFMNYETLIASGKTNIYWLENELKSAKAANRNILLLTMAGLVVSFVPALYLAIEFKMDVLIPVIMGSITYGFMYVGIRTSNRTT